MECSQTVLRSLLDQSATRHGRLCPRQVLGVRMGMAGADLLGLDVPRADKRLLVIAETDGCFASGVEAATGCAVGRRSLRIEDYGKVAATFIDTGNEQAVRIAPRREARLRAADYVPGIHRKWEAMLFGYQVMPASELFVVQNVQLDVPLPQIVSRPGKKAVCEVCREEIINGRETSDNGVVLCRACAGNSYYHLSVPAQSLQK